jgi:hypothetical protein
MDKRDVIELGELLEKIDLLIHEYLAAVPVERRLTLEAEITAAKEQLQKAAPRFKN